MTAYEYMLTGRRLCVSADLETRFTKPVRFAAMQGDAILCTQAYVRLREWPSACVCVFFAVLSSYGCGAGDDNVNFLGHFWN